MRRLAFALLAAVSIAACGGSDGATAPAGAPVAGTYLLQSMDGVAMPAVYFVADDYRFDVTGGSFALNADLTYRVALDMRYVGVAGVSDAPAQEFEHGTYTVSGSVVTLSSDAGGTMSATLSNSVLTMRMDGLSFVYRKP